MKEHNFYFRCKACNRPLNNHPKKNSYGLIDEHELCTVCQSAAFDSGSERQYQHQQITDDFIYFEKEESFIDFN